MAGEGDSAAVGDFRGEPPHSDIKERTLGRGILRVYNCQASGLSRNQDDGIKVVTRTSPRFFRADFVGSAAQATGQRMTRDLAGATKGNNTRDKTSDKASWSAGRENSRSGREVEGRRSERVG